MQGAMDDALAAMVSARHLSVDGSLASVLFSYKLETSITGVLTQNLLRLAPPQLHELASAPDALPSGSNLSTAFESEKLSLKLAGLTGPLSASELKILLLSALVDSCLKYVAANTNNIETPSNSQNKKKGKTNGQDAVRFAEIVRAGLDQKSRLAVIKLLRCGQNFDVKTVRAGPATEGS